MSTSKMDRRSNRRYNTRTSGGAISNKRDAHGILSVQNVGASSPKPSPTNRLMKQLQIDMCHEAITPRALIDSPIDNTSTNDEQYRLRRRISSAITPPRPQPVNKRKTKGQVRLFGVCDLNPNLWIKSTRPFFLEERLHSPIHKLIEINKKAMLAFQEPTAHSQPAATKTPKQIDQIPNSFNSDTPPKNAVMHVSSVVLVETITIPSSPIRSPNDDIDYEDQIVTYEVRQDMNMNESITVTSDIEKVAENTENASAEPMDCDDSLSSDDDVQLVLDDDELQQTDQAQEEEVSPKIAVVELKQNETSIIIDSDECLDCEDAAESAKSINLNKGMDLCDSAQSLETIDLDDEPFRNDNELEDNVRTETDMATNVAPTETSETDDVDMRSDMAPAENVLQIDAEPIENDLDMDAVPAEIRLDMDAEPAESILEMKAASAESAVENVVSEADAVPNETDVETCPVSATAPVVDEENLETPIAGQLVWARLGKFPFWPAIVHPDEDNITFNDKGVHVMFLADHRRTAWVKSRKSLIPYKGQPQYESYCEEALSKMSRVDLRNARNIYKVSTQEAWKLAVAECDVLAFVSIEHRIRFYTKILTDKSRIENLNDETISISSESTMSEVGKSESPCTFDTAYSSMKPSSSLSSISVLSMSTASSSINMFKNSEKQPTRPVSEPTVEKISRDEHIECFLRSVAENPRTNESRIDYESPQESLESNSKMSSPAYDECFSEASVKAKNIHDLILLVFKENIVVEDKDTQFMAAITRLRLIELSKKQSTSKRKRNSQAVANEAPKRKKVVSVLSTKGTARTKARASLPPAKPKPNTTPIIDPEEAKIREEKKENLKREKKLKIEGEFDGYAMQQHPVNYLFKGLNRGFYCQICMRPENVHMCSGGCGGFFHRECLSKDRNVDGWYAEYMGPTRRDSASIDLVTGEDFMEPSTLCSKSPSINNNGERFECGTCLRERKPKCIVCSEDKTDELFECSRKGCGCYYHVGCLKYWPQNKLTRAGDTVKGLMCPRHVCQICIADNPHRNYTSNLEPDQKLIKCVLCPASYHRKSICIPAGSELLSQSQMVCPRHRQTTKRPVNTDWCFLCCKGGSLICCETCPTAFHQDCLKIKQTDDKYICEECESGRLPLYGEIVWVKYCGGKWWPGMLADPLNVPKVVNGVKPGQNYACVRFFGTYDYGWICQGFMYLYQLEDSNFSKLKQNNNKYITATNEAFEWMMRIKEKYGEREVLRNRPQYIKLKVNRPVPPVKFEADEEVEEILCKCKPDDPFPCGPDNTCENYALSIECNANCPAKENCQNQRFAKRIYPKLQLKHFDSKGWGLIALEHIPCDTFIIEYVGDVIDSEEFNRRFKQSVADKAENFYFLSVENGLYIDSGRRGNEARFINHSCEPNCIPQKWQVGGQTRIGLFACVDIPVNTELTFDYNWSTIGIQKCVCYCGTKSCSGFIGFKSKPNKKS